MTNDEYYQKRKDNEHENGMIAIIIIFITVMTALVSYDVVDDAYDAEFAEHISVGVLGVGAIITLSILSYLSTGWIICDNCGKYIDYHHDFYINSSSGKHVKKGKQYHIKCFKERESLK